MNHIRSLRNDDGNAHENVDKKKLYFTYESHDILKSFTLSITVKAIVKLNPGNSDKFKIKFKNLAVVVHVLQTRKCTKSYNPRAQPLYYSLILLFSDVPVAVNSLMWRESIWR